MPHNTGGLAHLRDDGGIRNLILMNVSFHFKYEEELSLIGIKFPIPPYPMLGL